MTQRILMLLLIPLGALLQQLLPVWPIFGGIKPPILAALALYYALRRKNKDIWIAILVTTLMQDGLDVGPFGPALLAFPIIGMVAQRIRNEIFVDGLISQVFFGAAIGIFTTFVTLLIYTATGQRPFLFGTTVARLLGALCLGAITLPLVSIIVNKIEKALPKRRGYGWQ